MTRHQGIVVRALTWNLFHGRREPEEAPLGGPLLGRSLRDEFATAVAGLPWDVALLQEVPPGWLRPLARAASAGGASVLTSRNFPHLPRAAIARVAPDVIRSNEGGSNQLLWRPPWRLAGETYRVTIADRPERRRMLLARLRHPDGSELAVANLHASTGDRLDEVAAAARRAVAWACGAPLLFGGDLNLRPGPHPPVLGVSGWTAPDAIDHLLVRGIATREPPRALGSMALSDHAPVAATFEVK